jgi:hypothetical protein
VLLRIIRKHQDQVQLVIIKIKLQQNLIKLQQN